VKALPVWLVTLFFAGNCLAQAAGGAATGATVPAASTGAVSTIAAVVAVGVAGVAAAAGYNSTTTAAHH
jgi:type IV secretory pathway VirB2 component (pilin)